jgi:uracil-DNA glycosylase
LNTADVIDDTECLVTTSTETCLSSVQIDNTWKQVLANEFTAPYMRDLKKFLVSEKQAGKTIYPKGSDIFNAFNTTPLNKVRVVIIGQDPYHGPNQAHGLCFSVLPGIRPPASLQNIYKELQTDLQIPPVSHGYLLSWAKQGVLMLNSVLTVEQGKPESHKGRGWERFTDQVIHILNAQQQPLIFVLWGSHAQSKGQHIDARKHLILKAAHPSPFSAHRGFLGCKHFSKINAALVARSESPIDWCLPIKV